MFKKHLANHELISDAKKMYPNGKLPVGAILDGLQEQKNDLRMFIDKKKTDLDNEKFPMQTYQKKVTSKIKKWIMNFK